MSDEVTPVDIPLNGNGGQEMPPPWTIAATPQPQPLPTAWRMMIVGEWVELEMATPGGVGTYFLDHEAARRMGADLIKAGQGKTIQIARDLPK